MKITLTKTSGSSVTICDNPSTSGGSHHDFGSSATTPLDIKDSFATSMAVYEGPGSSASYQYTADSGVMNPSYSGTAVNSTWSFGGENNSNDHDSVLSFWELILSYCYKCGDGLNDGEACDDGNYNNGDGCTSTCTVETGYSCNTATWPTPCYPLCGDG